MPKPNEIKMTPIAAARYLRKHGNVCPLDGCGGSVDGTGAMEFIDADEIAVGRKCDKCGATWDDFYALEDISIVTKEA